MAFAYNPNIQEAEARSQSWSQPRLQSKTLCVCDTQPDIIKTAK